MKNIYVNKKFGMQMFTKIMKLDQYQQQEHSLNQIIHGRFKEDNC